MTSKKQLKGAAKTLVKRHGSHRETEHLRRLAHELRVHQYELDAQNVQLRESRKDAEKSIYQLAEMFARAPIGYLIVDPEGLVVRSNEMARAALGMPGLEAASLRLAARVLPRDRDVLANFLQMSWRESERTEVCEVGFFKSCGTLVEAKLTGVVLAQSDTPSLLVAVEDVTQQREWERQLRQSEKALLRAQRKTDSFLATLSHELRNPLASIRTSIEVLKHGSGGPDAARRSREVIERQAVHLSHLVDDLLDVTRIAHGKIKLHCSPLDISRAVSEAVETHQGQCADRGLTLHSAISESPVWVYADVNRLTQVISNILSNSQKFTPRGGRIDVTLRSSLGKAVLSIKDTGIGVDAEALSALCEPFFQVEQDLDRSSGGLGLGLGMVKSLVELQNGTLEVHSAGIDQGTEVVIQFPEQPAAPKPERVQAPSVMPSLKVIIIDDNEDSAESLKELLTFHGHDVSTANDGPRGLKAMRSKRADAVLCDIGLPAMNGYAVARNVRNDETLKDTYLIACTGYAQSEDRGRAMDAGFDYFLPKPCGAADVLKAIHARKSESG